MIKRFVLSVLVVSLCAGVGLFACASKSRGDSTQRKNQKAFQRFQDLHAGFVRRVKEGPMDILFIGDSLTEYWQLEGQRVWEAEYKKWKPANFGISGDTTSGVLMRLQIGEMDGAKPKVTVLLIGTNDLSVGVKPRTIADNIKQIVHLIKKKSPDTNVVLLGLFPRGLPDDRVRQQITEVNDSIATMDNGKDVRYLDLGKNFMSKNGELPLDIMPDTLHLSAKGYKIWADGMRPLLSEYLK